MTRRMRDGVYQVKTRYFCAGFIVSGGVVVSCAPILKQRFSHWVKFAREVKMRVKQVPLKPSLKRGRLQ